MHVPKPSHACTAEITCINGNRLMHASRAHAYYKKNSSCYEQNCSNYYFF